MLSNFAHGMSSQELVVEVELTISAKSLLNKDVMSKSDPICLVYIQLPNNSTWQEHGRTEVMKNNCNPEFATKIIIGYRFEEQQKLKFKIYDIDGSSPVLDDHDFLGEAECSLGQIVSSVNFVTALRHPSFKSKGQLFIRAEEIDDSPKEEVEFLFSAEGFKKSGFFSKPDPFLEIFRENTVVHRTAFIKNNCNPQWPKFTVPMRALCTKNGQDVKLLLRSWNYNKNGNHKLLGEIDVTRNGICNAPQTFNLMNKGKISGKLYVKEAVPKRTYSFLDYVMGGTRLNCTIAIDFTASNGSPNTMGSLHYMGPSPTAYEQALQSVVSIIQDYDSDKQFPVLGFGAKIPPNGSLSHEFFVNMSSNPYCTGVEGVIEAYRNCLPVVQLHGGTHFAPVINHVTRFASTYPNGDHYFILLILTDGAISDMHDTKEAIIAASHLPISIIIVGIGNADFSSMMELDSDNRTLNLNGKFAIRDIVQFVAFRDFLSGADSDWASRELARALLAEVPTQFLAFMKYKNITPKGEGSHLI